MGKGVYLLGPQSVGFDLVDSPLHQEVNHMGPTSKSMYYALDASSKAEFPFLFIVFSFSSLSSNEIKGSKS